MAIVKIVPVPGPQGPTGPGSSINNVKTQVWGYPTQQGVAISPSTFGESIAVKSQNSAALRWHVRDNSPSLAWGAEITTTAGTVIDNGDGTWNVTFDFAALDGNPAVGYHYYVNSNTESYTGSYISTAGSTTQLTLTYDHDPGQYTDAVLGQPSVYNQIEARENGVWVKNANWSEPDGRIDYWHFGTDGVFSGPAMGGVIVPAIVGQEGSDLYLSASSDHDVFINNGSGQAQVGYRYFPQVQVDGDITGNFTHLGKHLYNISNGQVKFTIPESNTVNYPIGTEIKFANNGASSWLFDRANTDTMTLVAEGQNYTNENFTFWLPSNGLATLFKVEDNRWIISGIRIND